MRVGEYFDVITIKMGNVEEMTDTNKILFEGNSPIGGTINMIAVDKPRNSDPAIDA
ncbi:MAG: hypothetical protein ACWIPH_09115 [Ostreibacterium sp.]